MRARHAGSAAPSAWRMSWRTGVRPSTGPPAVEGLPVNLARSPRSRPFVAGVAEDVRVDRLEQDQVRVVGPDFAHPNRVAGSGIDGHVGMQPRQAEHAEDALAPAVG